MPFQGFNFIRNQNFTRDRNAGPPDHFISAEKVDDELTNIADGLTSARVAAATADEKAVGARQRAVDAEAQAIATVRGVGIPAQFDTLVEIASALGLGQTQAVANARNVVIGGSASFAGTEQQSVAAGFPALGGAAGTSRYWNVTAIGRATRLTQTAVEAFGVGSTPGRKFSRRIHDDNVGPWVEDWTTANLTPAAIGADTSDQVTTKANAARDAAIAGIRGGVAAAYDTLSKLYDWTLARLNEKLNLAGGRMTGPLRLGPASHVRIEDRTDARFSWTLDSQNQIFGAYWNAEQDLGTAGYKFVVDRLGRVTTDELGDLKTYLDNLAATAAADATSKAGARVAKVGDTMTGPLAIGYANPILRLTNSGTRSWLLQAAGSILRVVDDTGGYSHTEIEPDGNILFRAAPGGAIRLGTIITQAAAGNAARTLVDTKFERLRLTGTFNSGTNGGYDAPAGGVITGYSREEGTSGRVGSIRGKYLQGWSPTNGWVNAINEG